MQVRSWKHTEAYILAPEIIILSVVGIIWGALSKCPKTVVATA